MKSFPARLTPLAIALAAGLAPGQLLAANVARGPEGPAHGGQAVGLETNLPPQPAAGGADVSSLVSGLKAAAAAAETAGRLDDFHAALAKEAEALALVPGFEAQAAAYRDALPQASRGALDARIQSRLAEIAERLKTNASEADPYNGFYSASHGGVAIWGPGGQPLTPPAARLMASGPVASADAAPKKVTLNIERRAAERKAAEDEARELSWPRLQAGDSFFTAEMKPGRVASSLPDGAARVLYLNERDGGFDSEGVLDAGAMAKLGRAQGLAYAFSVGDSVATADGRFAKVVALFPDETVGVQHDDSGLDPGLARYPAAALRRASRESGSGGWRSYDFTRALLKLGALAAGAVGSVYIPAWGFAMALVGGVILFLGGVSTGTSGQGSIPERAIPLGVFLFMASAVGLLGKLVHLF